MEDHKVIETVLFLSWSMGKPIVLCGVNPILRNARISAFFFFDIGFSLGCNS